MRKITQFIVSGSILFLPPYTQGEKKNIWSELESNFASQATTLTTKLPLLCNMEEALDHANYLAWLHFSYHPSREKTI